METWQSINKLLSHTALDPAFSKAINSVSILDLTMQVFLDDFQETAPSACVNTVGAFSGRIGLPPAVMGWAASWDDGP